MPDEREVGVEEDEVAGAEAPSCVRERDGAGAAARVRSPGSLREAEQI